jgi:two-component system sensor histidine kinase FlrB
MVAQSPETKTMHTDFQARSQALESAFQTFNEVSVQLAMSYQHLQQRVERLGEELAESRSERMRQLAEKEKLAERLTKLLETLPAGVVLLDGKRRLHELNPIARDLLGATAAGESWVSVEARVFVSGSSETVERTLADGRVIIITERALDQTPGSILVLQDVTEARLLQARLERQERLSEMGEMAAKLAHQVRTPLSSALLYVGHLSRDDLTRPQRQKFAARLRDRLQHMGRQVNDILAFSRGNDVQPSRLNVSDLLAEAIRLMQPLADARNARVSLSDRSGGDVSVLGNPDALQGAFANLIGNALDHGGDGVRVSIALSRSDDGRVSMSFSDNGPGVAADIRGQVFDPFFTTRSDGTGLGLAVVQSVVLAHHGRVSLADSESDGACFIIELPVAERLVGQRLAASIERIA